MQQTWRNICVLSIAFLFTYTGVSKLMNPSDFTLVLRHMPTLRPIATFVAYAIPIAEILLAVLLLFTRTRLAAMYAAATLLSSFTIYLFYMLYFTKDRPCSCGGVVSALSWHQHLFFNFFFILISIIGIALLKNRERMKASPP